MSLPGHNTIFTLENVIFSHSKKTRGIFQRFDFNLVHFAEKSKSFGHYFCSQDISREGVPYINQQEHLWSPDVHRLLDTVYILLESDSHSDLLEVNGRPISILFLSTISQWTPTADWIDGLMNSLSVSLLPLLMISWVREAHSFSWLLYTFCFFVPNRLVAGCAG